MRPTRTLDYTLLVSAVPFRIRSGGGLVRKTRLLEEVKIGGYGATRYYSHNSWRLPTVAHPTKLHLTVRRELKLFS
jgi:hypothetical protein